MCVFRYNRLSDVRCKSNWLKNAENFYKNVDLVSGLEKHTGTVLLALGKAEDEAEERRLQYSADVRSVELIPTDHDFYKWSASRAERGGPCIICNVTTGPRVMSLPINMHSWVSLGVIILGWQDSKHNFAITQNRMKWNSTTIGSLY